MFQEHIDIYSCVLIWLKFHSRFIHWVVMFLGTFWAFLIYSCHSWVSQSVSQFSHLVMLDSLRPHEVQHARPPCPSPTLKLMSIESVMPSNHLIFSHLFLLPPSIMPSLRVFSDESLLCIRWPKYCSFSFIISPSSEYSGLISFRMDFDSWAGIYILVILWSCLSLNNSFSHCLLST